VAVEEQFDATTGAALAISDPADGTGESLMWLINAKTFTLWANTDGVHNVLLDEGTLTFTDEATKQDSGAKSDAQR